MTGTAQTEAEEFMDIYNLEVIDVPTNLPIQRVDEDDEVYRTLREKDDALVALMKDCVERGQPALVGTTSIERSEELSARLKERKDPASGSERPLPRTRSHHRGSGRLCGGHYHSDQHGWSWYRYSARR